MFAAVLVSASPHAHLMHTPYIPSAHHAHTTCGGGCWTQCTEPPPRGLLDTGVRPRSSRGVPEKEASQVPAPHYSESTRLAGCGVSSFIHPGFTHAFINSCMYHSGTARQASIPLLTPSLPHTFPHAFMDSLTPSLTHHSFSHTLIHSFSSYLASSSNPSPTLGFSRDSVPFRLLPNSMSCCVCPL